MPVLLLAAVCVLLGACAQDLPPQDVTERFWRAVVTGHPDKLQRYVRDSDRAAATDGAGLLGVSAVEFGRTVIDGERASVETRVTLSGTQPLTLPLETTLVREGDTWRIDYPSTVAPISRDGEIATVIEHIEQLGDQLKQGIDRSVGELSAAIPQVEQELSRIERAFKQRVPALREQVEAFARRLEEAMKQAPAMPKPAPPPADAPGSTQAI